MQDLHQRNEDLLPGFDCEEDESKDQYEARLRAALPDFPSQVIRDWIVRHGESAFQEHGWLDYRRLRFDLTEMPTSCLLQMVLTSNEQAVSGWSRAIRTDNDFQETRLGQYMLRAGTWPVPPVVLYNPSGLVKAQGAALGRYHLLEGHHRLAYLKGLFIPPPIPALEFHEVWKAMYA